MKSNVNTKYLQLREIVEEEFACQRVGFLLSQTISNRNYLEPARGQVSNGNFITHCSALKWLLIIFYLQLPLCKQDIGIDRVVLLNMNEK